MSWRTSSASRSQSARARAAALKEGWLHKESRWIKKWHCRYVRLSSDGLLRTYTSEPSTYRLAASDTLSGTFMVGGTFTSFADTQDLPDCHITEELDIRDGHCWPAAAWGASHYQFRFAVTGGNRTLWFSAASAAERGQWLQALVDVQSSRHGIASQRPSASQNPYPQPSRRPAASPHPNSLRSSQSNAATMPSVSSQPATSQACIRQRTASLPPSATALEDDGRSHRGDEFIRHNSCGALPSTLVIPNKESVIADGAAELLTSVGHGPAERNGPSSSASEAMVHSADPPSCKDSDDGVAFAPTVACSLVTAEKARGKGKAPPLPPPGKGKLAGTGKGKAPPPSLPSPKAAKAGGKGKGAIFQQNRQPSLPIGRRLSLKKMQIDAEAFRGLLQPTASGLLPEIEADICDEDGGEQSCEISPVSADARLLPSTFDPTAVDLKELREAFAPKPKVQPRKTSKPASRLEILPRDVAQNVAIVLKKLGVDTKQLATALKNLDPTVCAISTDEVDRLLAVWPSAETLRPLIAYGERYASTPNAASTCQSGADDAVGLQRLRDVEHRMMPLVMLPRMKQKLRLIALMRMLPERVKETLGQLARMQVMCCELRNSTVMRDLLAIVLVVFNYVNFGMELGAQDQLQGVDVQTLLRLRETKAYNGLFPGFNMLHYVLRQLQRQRPELRLSDFEAELSGLEAAARISLERACQEIEDLRQKLLFVQEEFRDHRGAYEEPCLSDVCDGSAFEKDTAFESETPEASQPTTHTPSEMEEPDDGEEEPDDADVTCSTPMPPVNRRRTMLQKLLGESVNLARTAEAWIRGDEVFGNPIVSRQAADLGFGLAKLPDGESPPPGWLWLRKPSEEWQHCWCEIRGPLLVIFKVRGWRCYGATYCVLTGGEAVPFDSPHASAESQKLLEPAPYGFEVKCNAGLQTIRLCATRNEEVDRWLEALDTHSRLPGFGLLAVHQEGTPVFTSGGRGRHFCCLVGDRIHGFDRPRDCLEGRNPVRIWSVHRDTLIALSSQNQLFGFEFEDSASGQRWQFGCDSEMQEKAWLSEIKERRGDTSAESFGVSSEPESIHGKNARSSSVSALRLNREELNDPIASPLTPNTSVIESRPLRTGARLDFAAPNGEQMLNPTEFFAIFSAPATPRNVTDSTPRLTGAREDSVTPSSESLPSSEMATVSRVLCPSTLEPRIVEESEEVQDIRTLDDLRNQLELALQGSPKPQRPASLQRDGISTGRSSTPPTRSAISTHSDSEDEGTFQDEAKCVRENREADKYGSSTSSPARVSCISVERLERLENDLGESIDLLTQGLNSTERDCRNILLFFGLEAPASGQRLNVIVTEFIESIMLFVRQLRSTWEDLDKHQRSHECMEPSTSARKKPICLTSAGSGGSSNSSSVASTPRPRSISDVGARAAVTHAAPGHGICRRVSQQSVLSPTSTAEAPGDAITAAHAKRENE